MLSRCEYAMTNLSRERDHLSLSDCSLVGISKERNRSNRHSVDLMRWTHHVWCTRCSSIYPSSSNEVRSHQSILKYLIFCLSLELSQKENHFYASMSHIPHANEEDFIYDTDGCLLFMQTAQSNLSLFNISCDSLLIFNENKPVDITSTPPLNPAMKHSNSSWDLHFDTKRSEYRSTMLFNDEIFAPKTSTLQRWQGLELLNTYAE